jgi:hypothetical protein
VIRIEKLPKQLFRDGKKMKHLYLFTVFRVKIQEWTPAAPKNENELGTEKQ